MNDPPDAPEDAAVFMHDISHSAWHQFTRHVAKEAASISGSSLYTAQAVDHHAAEVRPPHLLASPAAVRAQALCVRQTSRSRAAGCALHCLCRCVELPRLAFASAMHGYT